MKGIEGNEEQQNFLSKVCVVTVTYGNRFKYLEKVINSCLREGVDKIIVVDNDSYSESRQKLKELEKKESKLKVIYLDENKGSAGGYKRGLEEAYKCKECEYILTLDDDNVLQKKTLNIFKKFYKLFEKKNDNYNFACVGFRPKINKNLINIDSVVKLPMKNSFKDIHIIDLPNKILKKIKKVFLANKSRIKVTREEKKIRDYIVIPMTGYGGLFFKKDLLDIIGYPNESWFLYEDNEWTYRITKNGGNIYLIFNAIIDDLEEWWSMKNNFGNFIINLLLSSSEMRLYYSTRNNVIFLLNNFVTNYYLFRFNIFLFQIIMLVHVLFLKDKNKALRNMKTINKAIKDGLKFKI